MVERAVGMVSRSPQSISQPSAAASCCTLKTGMMQS